MPDQLTVSEAAACARVSPRTIERWIRAGVLPAQRFGPRLLRISATDLAHVGRPVEVAAQ
ncbi:helix-turn-helix domain-containing protein [Mycobacterium paraintracellulare]|uniref:helix-turn-helix domain-containing protein n=1 Tax=Mycobacterium paraintracellulare TaxID=1138383 RepID=UPI00191601A7|nr:helix-turn-helix domain-containing protein [Mycobacterium paraintracellulare]